MTSRTPSPRLHLKPVLRLAMTSCLCIPLASQGVTDPSTPASAAAGLLTLWIQNNAQTHLNDYVSSLHDDMAKDRLRREQLKEKQKRNKEITLSVLSATRDIEPASFVPIDFPFGNGENGWKTSFLRLPFSTIPIRLGQDGTLLSFDGDRTYYLMETATGNIISKHVLPKILQDQPDLKFYYSSLNFKKIVLRSESRLFVWDIETNEAYDITGVKDSEGFMINDYIHELNKSPGSKLSDSVLDLHHADQFIFVNKNEIMSFHQINTSRVDILRVNYKDKIVLDKMTMINDYTNRILKDTSITNYFFLSQNIAAIIWKKPWDSNKHMISFFDLKAKKTCGSGSACFVKEDNGINIVDGFWTNGKECVFSFDSMKDVKFGLFSSKSIDPKLSYFNIDLTSLKAKEVNIKNLHGGHDVVLNFGYLQGELFEYDVDSSEFYIQGKPTAHLYGTDFEKIQACRLPDHRWAVNLGGGLPYLAVLTPPGE